VTRTLCYHDVVAPRDRNRTGFPGPVSARYKLTPEQFERHLDAFVESGVRVGLLDQLPDVALTFDDGGASALTIAGTLERRGLRGHFFIVTGRLGEAGFLEAGGVRELVARGHAIGSHSHTHPPYIERLAPAALVREWRTSRERLAELLGEPPRLAAVPGGRLSRALIEVVAAAGYELLLSCEPTSRVREHGPLTVRGRYTIWSATPSTRAAAYARGDCCACLGARARWRIKRAARAASPAHYERARRARALLTDKAGNLARLSLKGRSLGAAKAGGDQSLPQRRVVDQALDGVGGGGGVVRRDEQRAVAERAHPTDGGGHRRQPAGVSLDQDLREPLGPGHVQERVACAVQLEQPPVERDVAADLAVVGEPELLDARHEGIGQVALAAHDQPPACVPLAQQHEHLGEQQGILLGVEPPDCEELEGLGVIGPVRRAGASLDVRGADQRNSGIEDSAGTPVAGGQVWAHCDYRDAQREHAPAPLECAGGDMERAAPGVAMADIGGEVLSYSEHKPPAPEQRKQRKRDRVRVGTERQDGVGVVERSPHGRDRARHGAQHRANLREARVMWQRHELDRVVEQVVRGPRSAVEAPEQPQPAELPGESPEKAHEGALAEHLAVPLTVEVIGVYDQAHDRRSAPCRPAVSVLIPVLDEAGVLERTVPTMLAQRLDGEIEFLFAEGRSSDGSREVLGRFAAEDRRVHVLDNPSGHTPDGLNVALAAARGEFVARMDAHCFYPPTYLADGIARLTRGDVAWVAGPAVPRGDGGFSGTVALALGSPLGRGPSRRLARPGALGELECDLDTGVFAGVWRRSTLARYGGWDARWLRNQDSELAARFLTDGHRIVSLPGMAAEYVPRRTLAAFLRQYHDYGRYRALTLARHPLARRRSHALAPALVGALAAALTSPRLLRVPARAALTAYAAAVGVETGRALRRAPLKDVLGLPLAFAAMHIGWGVGMWRGFAGAWRSQQDSSNNH
jgi:succinoglycan biosynthesis protein ExoA